MSQERMSLKQILQTCWGRCLFAFVVVSVAAALRVWPLQPLESSLAWLTFYPAVIGVALYGGLSAALLATVLACLTVAFLWPFLVARPFIASPIDLLGMGVFALTCMAVCYVIDTMRRANARATEAQKQAESAALAAARSERFMKSAIEAMPNMIGYWDKDLRFGLANNAYMEWWGKRPEDIIGTSIRDLMGERLYALNEPHIRRALAGETQRFQRTLTKADGSAGYILANYIPDIDVDGAVNGIFILASDVTELKEAQSQLELAASVFENTVEGIAVTNAQGIFLSVNPAFTAITGYTAEEAIGQTPRILRSNRHDHAFYVAMWHDILTNGRWKGDIWNRRKDGEVYLERITITMIRDSAGNPVRYVSVFSDITDLWRKDEYLKHLAFHDALTDLPNRSLLMERLNHRISMAERTHVGLALLFLDLDRFKFINDTYGHDVGDELLREVAQRLLVLVRQSDTVARLGGDEFVIKLNNPANKDEIAHIARRIVAVINEPMELRGNTVQVGTSIGIAIYPADGRTPVELLKHADSAMYAAKDAGKSTFRFFEPSMTVPGDERQDEQRGDKYSQG
jgi:diguanylate cyclase (GGDEF)-like protein/PAS domain S-box-containing protein